MEGELRRLNRAYRALGMCCAAVGRATDEDHLLASLCSMLVDVGGYRMAWVGYKESDADRNVRVAAIAGTDGGYLRDAKIQWNEGLHGRGPTGVAIRTGKVAINRDSRTNPVFAPWRELALAHGYGSSIAVPLLAEGTVLGALMVYATEPEAFDEEECDLLVHLAGALTHGIAALRTRRTLEIREEQLRQTAKMEALGQLAGGLAHDVNNLLSVILYGATELQTALAGDDERQSLVGDIRASAEAATDLTRQILAFGRRPTGRSQPVVLSQFVDKLQRMLSRSVGKGVILAISSAPDLAPTDVDPAEIEEVLVNLAINARDAMAGKGRLTVELRNVDHTPANAILPPTTTGPFVEIVIRDTGEGMSPEVMSHLFEPFFTTKPEGKGTGLGLAMVLHAVKRYGGQIAVDSSPGRGTEFRLLLPADVGRPHPS